MPDDLYANIDLDRMGNPIDVGTLCGHKQCPMPNNTDNIIGKRFDNSQILSFRIFNCNVCLYNCTQNNVRYTHYDRNVRKTCIRVYTIAYCGSCAQSQSVAYIIHIKTFYSQLFLFCQPLFHSTNELRLHTLCYTYTALCIYSHTRSRHRVD